MVEIFKAAIEQGASDIHIKAGDVVRARIHGRLVPMTEQRLSNDQVRQLASRLMPREADREQLDELTDYDCSWGLSGVGRFRVNVLRQRGSFMIVMRVIPIEIPTFGDLQLPSVLTSISESDRGLVLVTGVTGSGKTSTMAAMVGYMNKHMNKHIVTLEDPIEFLHRDRQCSITQREVGTDTSDFKTGLRAALRQDPDVIQVGEMRDKETIDIALKAAETGHLVISTLHTQDAVRTISRVISVFDPTEQETIRIRLSESLRAVLSQRLLPRADTDGRIAAVEVMLVTGTIRDCIRDPDRLEEIPELIAEGREHYGSQTFDQYLMDLVRTDKVEFQVAKAAATNPSDFDLKMNMLSDERAEAAESKKAQDMSHLFGG